MEEIRLIDRAAEGDRDALQILMVRFRPRIFSVAYHLLGDREEAEDLTQEALLRAIDRLPYFDARKGSFLNWLVTLTVRLGFNWLEKKKREGLLRAFSSQGESWSETADWDPNGFHPDPSNDYHRQQLIRLCLSRLPETQRSALLLRYGQGMSVREISELLGVADGTVKSWLFRGREALRVLFKEIGLL